MLINWGVHFGHEFLKSGRNKAEKFARKIRWKNSLKKFRAILLRFARPNKKSPQIRSAKPRDRSFFECLPVASWKHFSFLNPSLNTEGIHLMPFSGNLAHPHLIFSEQLLLCLLSRKLFGNFLYGFTWGLGIEKSGNSERGRADGIGVKFPIFPGNGSCLLLS